MFAGAAPLAPCSTAMRLLAPPALLLACLRAAGATPSGKPCLSACDFSGDPTATGSNGTFASPWCNVEYPFGSGIVAGSLLNWDSCWSECCGGSSGCVSGGGLTSCTLASAATGGIKTFGWAVGAPAPPPPPPWSPFENTTSTGTSTSPAALGVSLGIGIAMLLLLVACCFRRKTANAAEQVSNAVRDIWNAVRGTPRERNAAREVRMLPTMQPTVMYMAQPMAYMAPTAYMAPAPQVARPLPPSPPPPATAFEWDFFLSHVQAEGGQNMRLLHSRLVARGLRCWLDMCLIPSGQNIERDVPRSRIFLLYLTRSIFTRKWCLFEILCALRARRPIMLLLENHPAAGAAATDINALLASMPRAPGTKRPLLKPLLDQCVALPSQLQEIEVYTSAMIDEIARCLNPSSQRAVVVNMPSEDLWALEAYIQDLP